MAEEELENLEKYIFDPKNPKGCKVYKLLLKLVKERNSSCYISPLFFLQIFESQIFDKDLTTSLWDKPENFNELTVLEKLEVYVNNFAINDFYYELHNKTELFNKTKIKHHFLKFLWGSYNEATHSFSFDYQDTISIGHDTWSYIRQLNDITRKRPIEAEPHKEIEWAYLEYPQIVGHMVFFLSEGSLSLLSNIHFDHTSIAIVPLNDYINNPIRKTLGVHPLLLKDIRDVNYLLEVLYQDVLQERSKEQHKEEPIHLIKQIEIRNFFSIERIKLEKLDSHNEVYLVGENGDGKTSVLQAITLALKGQQQEGLIIDFLKENFRSGLSLTAKDTKVSYEYSSGTESYKNLFAYGVNRTRNDSDKKDETGYLSLFSSEQYLDNPVKWLQHLDYKQAKGEDTGISLETAKQLLKAILDENVEIEVGTEGVWFVERGTKLKFEQLSEGYRSVIIWVSDLIKRLSENQPYALHTKDFRGIVLVDEIELHLHPKWKYRIVSDLRQWFPGIQFFFTTHSPTVLLGASKNAIFYKVYKEDGITKVSEPLQDIGNLTANSLITSPLFGLETATPKSGGIKAAINASSDDYISQKIHEVISRKINEQPNIQDEDVMRLVEEELAKFENPQS